MNLVDLVKLVGADIKIFEDKKENLPEIKIKGANSFKLADSTEVTFLSNKKYIQELQNTRSNVVIIDKKLLNDYLPKDKVYLVVDDVKKALYLILNRFTSEEDLSGISNTAIIAENTKLPDNVYVGEYVVIRENCVVEERVKIHPYVFIGKNVEIGKNSVIYEHTVIKDNTKIGEDVIIHSGCIIGSDGFGYIKEKEKNLKIKQCGGVQIGNNVEIGCNVTIDKATIGKTIIGDGTKIDNLVHIAHNVEIGKNCLIIAQAGIAGSAKIGDSVVIAGQAGIPDHVTIGDGAIIAAQTGVISDVESGKVVSGFPAREHKKTMRINALLDKLPEIYKHMKK